MPSTQNPLADARTQLAEAIQFLGFDEGMRRMLEPARKEAVSYTHLPSNGPKQLPHLVDPPHRCPGMS